MKTLTESQKTTILDILAEYLDEKTDLNYKHIREVQQISRVLKHKPKKGKGNEVIVAKIKDFTKDKHEPAIDVEVYINGKYDGTHDGVISTQTISKQQALEQALKKTIDKLSLLSYNQNLL